MNDEKVIIYHSQEQSSQHMIVFNHDESVPIGIYPFGLFTMQILNALNSLVNGEEIVIPNVSNDKISKLGKNINEWKEHMYNLTEIISQRNKLNLDSLNSSYQLYKLFFSIILSNRSFNEHYNSIVNNNENSIKISNHLSYEEHLVLGDNVKYIKYKATDISYLFALDLYEVLFNNTLTYRFKKCIYCNTFFITDSQKNKYCDECREIMPKIRYEQRKNNKISYLRKQICDKLAYRSKSSKNNDYNSYVDEFLEFQTEANYYNDIINGEKIIPKNEYNHNIRTEEDFINWLEAYLDSIRIYKKGEKNGETSKKS